jgi:REP element-mobilizing transposase RayT
MLMEECERVGWRGEALVRPDRVHLLLEIPSNVHRDQVVRTVRDLAATVARRAGVTRTGQRVWEESCWCSVLNGPAVEAVRQWLRRVSPH